VRLRFKVQRFQTEAVDAAADCFAGQPRLAGPDAVTGQGDPAEQRNAEIALSPAELLANIRAVQRRHGLPLSSALARSPAAATAQTPNLDIEMETGTGKTYVYIKTIMELNRRYGWSKFIVVVPSVAIREGVLKSFEVTGEHFQQAYGSRPRPFSYRSSQLHAVQCFASDHGVQVMIINIQAFNAAGQDSRRIYEVLDDFQSRRPIDVISATRPIVIIDEPQRISADKSLRALAQLRPLMLLRYSATHRAEHDKVYRLDALEAYRQRLVKKIAVRGLTVRGLAGTAAYLYLDAIETRAGAPPQARVEVEVRTRSGVRRQLKRLDVGVSLHQISGGLEAYRGLAITQIDAARGEVQLSSGDTIATGQVSADVTEQARRRIQIREVIRAHLDKERDLFPLGIKVLSLLFIDEVAKYRDHTRADTGGEYAEIFAEEYAAQVSDLLGRLTAAETEYRSYLMAIPAAATHRGYFSIDRKTGRAIDGNARRTGDERGQSADADAYDLILRDKERLLSLSEQTRFIFSHSTLREGWDNPNVFVLGMLKRSDSTVSRRQEIGRGLRLSVDQRGERTDNPLTVHEVNELTVVTDESYTAFVAGLQREVGGPVPASTVPASTVPATPDPAYPVPADGRIPRQPALRSPRAGRPEAPRVAAFDSADLVARCVTALDDRLIVGTPQYFVQTAAGITAHAADTPLSGLVASDLIGELANRTRLTRRTIGSILHGIGPVTFAQYQRHPSQFITESARLINEQLSLLAAGR
jgi:type III restriction enzyme